MSIGNDVAGIGGKMTGFAAGTVAATPGEVSSPFLARL